MKADMGKTLYGALLATVAGGVILVATQNTAHAAGWFGKDEEPQEFQMRRPAGNPPASMGRGAPAGDEQVMRTPAANPTMEEQAGYQSQAGTGTGAVMQPSYSAPSAPAAQKRGGMFSWLYKDEPAAELPAGPRKVPVGNRNPAAAPAPASYQESVPVAGVDMAPLEPQEPMMLPQEPMMTGQVPVEEGYPDLASVPPRPERLDAAAKKDDMMADLIAAREATQAQNADMAAFSPEEAFFAPQAQAAPVPMATADASATGDVVVGERDISAEFAALVSGGQPASANAAPVGAVSSWEPAPLVPVDGSQDEWVDVRQDPMMQASAPVPQVSVASQDVVAVSAIPVEPEWHGAGAITLTPPSGIRQVRTLPESRYAARRQAIYMQRYARHMAAYRNNDDTSSN
ncbi:MAG: hypothetical protein ACPG80_02930 [Rickettsiales bacterium]